MQPRSPCVSSTEQWIVPVTRLASASRMNAATFSSGGGSQSSLGSRVSFQCSQICRLSSVSRLISGNPCALANRSAPSPTSRQCRVALHDQAGDGRGVHDVADRGHRAAAVGRPVHDGGVELDDAVLVGETAVADRVVLGVGLHDRHALDRRVERVVPLLDQLHRLLDRPQAVAAGDDDRLLGCRRASTGAAPMASVLKLAAAVEAMKSASAHRALHRSISLESNLRPRTTDVS